MVTPTKGARLGSSPAHERLILANLASSLYEHGSIKTTLVRAKRLRPYAEHLITIAKKGTLASRRQVMTKIRNKTIVHLLMTEIAEQFAERDGGYTRIIKIERRKGDQAEMAIIELVTEAVTKNPKAKTAKVADSAPKATADEKADEAATSTESEAPTEAPEAAEKTADEAAEVAADGNAEAAVNSDDADADATAEVATEDDK